jgi:NitT/TauT family transport system permease protein
MSDARFIWTGRVVTLVVLLAAWEGYARFVDGRWISQPSLILERLGTWATGDLAVHLGTTLAEMALGLAAGMPAGILCGLVLGRAPLAAALLRPVIVAFYSVPLVTLAPLLILWFGLDLQPKIVLVGVVSFFLVFFNTFSGVVLVDRDLVATLELMGARRLEIFRKLILPAATPWILSGLKIALPYALIAATVGEMMAARHGMGSLITNAAAQVDMTGLYAALVVLMGVGVVVGEGANLLEARLLHWRASGR